MQHSRTIEVFVGLFVAIGLVALFFLAMQVSNLSDFRNGEGYVIKARFDNIGSLKVRSPVAISGVKIGRVSSVIYDTDDYSALVEITINPEYNKLPDDTSASIFTAGLLGEQYIGLEAGGSDEYLKPGDFIDITQPALILENIIGHFLFGKDDSNKGTDSSTESSNNEKDECPCP